MGHPIVRCIADGRRNGKEEFPVNQDMLTKRGVYNLELVDSRALVRDKAWEFLFVLGQPSYVGSTQVNINPVVIRRGTAIPGGFGLETSAPPCRGRLRPAPEEEPNGAAARQRCPLCGSSLAVEGGQSSKAQPSRRRASLQLEGRSRRDGAGGRNLLHGSAPYQFLVGPVGAVAPSRMPLSAQDDLSSVGKTRRRVRSKRDRRRRVEVP